MTLAHRIASAKAGEIHWPGCQAEHLACALEAEIERLESIRDNACEQAQRLAREKAELLRRYEP